MNLLIRAESNTQIGTGHVMRCLALAQAWQETGGEACFLLAFSVPALEARLAAEGMKVVHLDGCEPGSAEDARQTAVIAQQHQASWIVVDGYHFGADYQQQLKMAGFRVLFIDDYGHAAHYYADIVLNQNIYAQSEMYTSREPDTQLLLGTKYVLLRREFWAWRDWQRPIPEKARKILVTLGGSDPDNVTLTVIQALKQMPYDGLEAIVLVGAQNPHYGVLQTAVADDTRIQLRSNVTNMPELMAWADVAVSAGGSTSWELAFMGVPASIVALAENQRPVMQHLADNQAAIALGWHSSVTSEKIKRELSRLTTSPRNCQAMRQQGHRLVDGCGVKRLINLLQAPWLTLRFATPEDSELIWRWANDPIVRSASFSTATIPWESHQKWFHTKLADPNCIFYIACDPQAVPMGQARYDIENEKGVISVSLASEFRGYGYGTQLIRLATQKFFVESGVSKVLAYVKETNIASRQTFMKAGFQEVDKMDIKGSLAVLLEMKRDEGIRMPC